MCVPRWLQAQSGGYGTITGQVQLVSATSFVYVPTRPTYYVYNVAEVYQVVGVTPFSFFANSGSFTVGSVDDQTQVYRAYNGVDVSAQAAYNSYHQAASLTQVVQRYSISGLSGTTDYLSYAGYATPIFWTFPKPDSSNYASGTVSFAVGTYFCVYVGTTNDGNHWPMMQFVAV